jgi:hypothetical protein
MPNFEYYRGGGSIGPVGGWKYTTVQEGIIGKVGRCLHGHEVTIGLTGNGLDLPHSF